MADWSGSARTNYVRVIDVAGLRSALAPFEVTVEQHDDQPEFFCIMSEDEFGGWPTIVTVENNGDPALDGQDVEFDFSVQVMPFVQEGEVLVAMEAGAERLRYVTGAAAAFVRRNGDIQSVEIGLPQIYGLAAEKFGIMKADIAPCTYMDLSDTVENEIKTRQTIAGEKN